MGVQGQKNSIPQLVQVISQLDQPSRAQPVETPGALLTDVDQSRFSQDPEMLGDGRPTYGQFRCQDSHGTRPVLQALQDSPSRRVTQRVALNIVSIQLL